MGQESIEPTPKDPAGAAPRNDGDVSTPASTNVTNSGVDQKEASLTHSSESHDRASMEDQKTVISKTPVISPAEYAPSGSPRDLGRVLEGQQLGHFQLDEFIGGGGMGAVFRASDLRLDRTVAVKVVSNDRADPDTLLRFRNEAQSAARLDHPNIARVYFVDEAQGWHFIVFEYIEGPNLRDLIDHKGALSLDEAITYTLQVAEALDHAQHRAVIHRDVKPSNILVTPDGHVKLVDMGLARLHHVEASSRDLTASGVTLGTFDYISPEQAHDPRNTDVRSDIYSLGCTLYFMLVGQPPFPTGTVLQKLLSHSSDPVPDPRDVRPDLDERVVGILTKMLEKKPADRHQAPQELIGELLLLANDLDLPIARKGGTIWISPSTESPVSIKSLVTILPIVLMVAAIFIVEYLARPRAENPGMIIPDLPARSRTREKTLVTVNPRSSGETPLNEIGRRPGVVAIDVLDEVMRPAEGGETSEALSPGTDVQKTGDALPKDLDIATDQSNQELPAEVSDGVSGRAMVAAVEPRSLEISLVEPAFFEIQSSLQLDSERILAETGVLEPNRIVVSRSPISFLDAIVIQDLGQVWDLVEKNAEIRTIELHFNGVMELPPLIVDLKLSEVPQVSLRAGAGYSPILKFRPSLTEFITIRDPAMIELRDGWLSWEGIHFEFELPTSFTAEPQESWSMFQIHAGNHVDFNDCTLTILNEGESMQSLHDAVTFFSVRPAVGVETPEAKPEVRSTRIDFKQSIVRGQASLVASRTAVPFQLTWQQGMLATTERLFEIGGASDDPEDLLNERIGIELINVTAILGKGLGRITLRNQTPHLMGTDLRNVNCLFQFPRDRALVEHFRVETSEYARQRFEFDGNENYYFGSSFCWAINTSDGQSERYPLRVKDEPWYKETSLRASGETVSAAVPVHLMTPADIDKGTEPGDETILGKAGFLPSVLPRLPQQSSRPSAAN